jgi:hypothetical protein
MYNIIIFSICSVVSKRGCLLETKHKLQMFQNQTPIEIFGAVKDEVMSIARYFVICTGTSLSMMSD